MLPLGLPPPNASAMRVRLWLVASDSEHHGAVHNALSDDRHFFIDALDGSRTLDSTDLILFRSGEEKGYELFVPDALAPTLDHDLLTEFVNEALKRASQTALGRSKELLLITDNKTSCRALSIAAGSTHFERFLVQLGALGDGVNKDRRVRTCDTVWRNTHNSGHSLFRAMVKLETLRFRQYSIPQPSGKDLDEQLSALKELQHHGFASIAKAILRTPFEAEAPDTQQLAFWPISSRTAKGLPLGYTVHRVSALCLSPEVDVVASNIVPPRRRRRISIQLPETVLIRVLSGVHSRLLRPVVKIRAAGDDQHHLLLDATLDWDMRVGMSLGGMCQPARGLSCSIEVESPTCNVLTRETNAQIGEKRTFILRPLVSRRHHINVIFFDGRGSSARVNVKWPE